VNPTRPDGAASGGGGDEHAERKDRVLILEDDRALREGLVMNFGLRGHEVISTSSGDEGLRLAFDARPDLIILDLMLPGISGLEILSELRERGERVPVLILSARDTTDQKVQGLQTGADDYVTKPFELPELLARAEGMLARQRIDRAHRSAVSFGQVTVDPVARTVTKAERPVTLSAKEFDLLWLLASAPDRPFSRETILTRIWGWDFEGTARTVNNFILNLRQKLEDDPAHPRHLLTVRQVGYKLVR